MLTSSWRRRSWNLWWRLRFAPLSTHCEPQNDEYFHCLNYTATSIVIIRSAVLNAIFYSHHSNGGGGFHFTLSLLSCRLFSLLWIEFAWSLENYHKKNWCCLSETSDILRCLLSQYILIWFPFLGYFISGRRLFNFLIFLLPSSSIYTSIAWFH